MNKKEYYDEIKMLSRKTVGHANMDLNERSMNYEPYKNKNINYIGLREGKLSDLYRKRNKYKINLNSDEVVKNVYLSNYDNVESIKLYIFDKEIDWIDIKIVNMMRELYGMDEGTIPFNILKKGICHENIYIIVTFNKLNKDVILNYDVFKINKKSEYDSYVFHQIKYEECGILNNIEMNLPTTYILIEINSKIKIKIKMDKDEITLLKIMEKNNINVFSISESLESIDKINFSTIKKINLDFNDDIEGIYYIHMNVLQNGKCIY
jgi:hypothetical protein